MSKTSQFGQITSWKIISKFKYHLKQAAFNFILKKMSCLRTFKIDLEYGLWDKGNLG